MTALTESREKKIQMLKKLYCQAIKGAYFCVFILHEINFVYNRFSRLDVKILCGCWLVLLTAFALGL